MKNHINFNLIKQPVDEYNCFECATWKILIREMQLLALAADFQLICDWFKILFTTRGAHVKQIQSLKNHD